MLRCDASKQPENAVYRRARLKLNGKAQFVLAVGFEKQMYLAPGSRQCYANYGGSSYWAVLRSRWFSKVRNEQCTIRSSY